jgi:putative acetyltransferase
MHIRPATENDAEAIAAAEQQTAAAQEGLLASRPHEISADAVRSKIVSMRDNGLFIVLEEKGEVLGHLLLERMDLESTRHVVRLTIVVHPGYTGKGHGRQLMDHAIAWAVQSEDVEKIELNVRPNNSRAVKLYESCGFEVEGVYRDRIKLTHGYADDVAMALFVRACNVRNGGPS